MNPSDAAERLAALSTTGDRVRALLALNDHDWEAVVLMLIRGSLPTVEMRVAVEPGSDTVG